MCGYQTTSEIQSTRYPCMVYLPTLGWCIMVNVGKYTVSSNKNSGKPWIVRQMSQAVICGIYHYCDQHRIGTDLSGPSCSEPSYRDLDQSWLRRWWQPEIREKLPFGCIKPVVNHGDFNYQAQLVSLPDFWTVNSRKSKFKPFIARLHHLLFCQVGRLDHLLWFLVVIMQCC